MTSLPSRQQLQQRLDKLKQELQQRQSQEKQRPEEARQSRRSNSLEKIAASGKWEAHCDQRKAAEREIRNKVSPRGQQYRQQPNSSSRARQLMRRHLCARRAKSRHDGHLQSSLYRFLDQHRQASADKQDRDQIVEKQEEEKVYKDEVATAAAMKAKERQRRRVLVDAIERLRRLSLSAMDSASNAAQAPPSSSPHSMQPTYGATKYPPMGSQQQDASQPPDIGQPPTSAKQPPPQHHQQRPSSGGRRRDLSERQPPPLRDYPDRDRQPNSGSQSGEKIRPDSSTYSPDTAPLVVSSSASPDDSKEGQQQQQQHPPPHSEGESLPAAAAMRERLEQLDANLSYLALACRTLGVTNAGSCGGVELARKISDARRLVSRMLAKRGNYDRRTAACCGDEVADGSGEAGNDKGNEDPLFWRCPAHADASLHSPSSQRGRGAKRRERGREKNPVARLVNRSEEALLGDPVFQVSCAGKEYKWGRMTLPVPAPGNGWLPNSADRLGRANLQRCRVRELRRSALAEVDEFADCLRDKWETVEAERIDRAIDAACRRLRLARRCYRRRRRCRRQAASKSATASRLREEEGGESGGKKRGLARREGLAGSSKTNPGDTSSIKWGVEE